jgi:VanZ family protein
VTNDEADRMTIKPILKVCSVAALVLLVFLALGPATWQPRSGLGWQIDHFIGYFVFTLMFCLAWPRPLVVGGALIAFAVLLENLQALLPDRSSYFVAALYSAAGVLTAALLAELFIRARRRFQSKWAGEGNDRSENTTLIKGCGPVKISSNLRT